MLLKYNIYKNRKDQKYKYNSYFLKCFHNFQMRAYLWFHKLNIHQNFFGVQLLQEHVTLATPFEIESGYPLSPALSTVQQELKALWAYAGYEDILMSNSNLVVEIRKLHKSYKDLLNGDLATAGGGVFSQPLSGSSRAPWAK